MNDRQYTGKVIKHCRDETERDRVLLSSSETGAAHLHGAMPGHAQLHTGGSTCVRARCEVNDVIALVRRRHRRCYDQPSSRGQIAYYERWVK